MVQGSRMKHLSSLPMHVFGGDLLFLQDTMNLAWESEITPNAINVKLLVSVCETLWGV